MQLDEPKCGRGALNPEDARNRGVRAPRLHLIRHGIKRVSALWMAIAMMLATIGVFAAPTTTPVLRGPHPYLYFTADRIANLKERIAHEKSSADSWAAILTNADRAVQKPADAASALESLALAYRMSGDKRYAGRVRDILMGEIHRPNWGEPDLLRRDPVWHAGLGTARSCYSAAVAFDSVHDALSADERREIAQGIVELGIRPTLDDWVLGATRIHALDTMGHNWWSACVFSAGVAALAVLEEEPRAAAWLQQISDGSVEWFRYAGSVIENKPANFDAAGGFYESVNYASFALSEYLLFRLAWTNALREPAAADIPLLARSGNFFLDVCYPNSGPAMTLNFGDGSINADGSRPLALLWANGYHDPNALWYLAARRSMSYREGLDRTTPLGLVYFPSDAELAAAPTAPTLPVSAMFGNMGWAMLRSSWEKNGTLLGVKSGYTWNHSHADAGSFILFHGGENILIDSGNANYGRPEYDAYYRQSTAHNVVLFNGAAENPEDTYSGSKFPGRVSHLIDTGDFKYLFADATGPTSKNFNRNYRQFVWIGDVIVIIDDVESFTPGQFEWLLHYNGKAERRGLDLNVTHGSASVIVRPLFPEMFPDAGLSTDYPEKMRLVEKSGFKDHEPDVKQPYLAFAPAELTRRTKFITAITLVTAANQKALPKIERLSAKNMMGVRIHQHGTTTDIFLNLLADGSLRHRNANNILGGWETDAYLLALTYSDGADVTSDTAASRIFVADGSYLRRGGKVVLDSLSKVFLAEETTGDALAVQLQGQPVINASWHAVKKPVTLRVNGQLVDPAYETASESLMLSVGHE